MISEKRAAFAAASSRFSDRRLFMQLLAFGDAPDIGAPHRTARGFRSDGVLYEDVNDPRGVAASHLERRSGYFICRVRPFLNRHAFRGVDPEARIHDDGADLCAWSRAQSRGVAAGPASARSSPTASGPGTSGIRCDASGEFNSMPAEEQMGDAAASMAGSATVSEKPDWRTICASPASAWIRTITTSSSA